MKDGMAGKSGERSRSLSRKETRILKMKIFLKDGKFTRKVQRTSMLIRMYSSHSKKSSVKKYIIVKKYTRI